MQRNSYLALTLFLLMAVLSPLRAQRVERHSPKLSAHTLAALHEGNTKRVQAFITLRPDAQLSQLSERYGVQFNVKAGRHYTALLPLRQVAALAREATVEHIDLGTQAQPMLDRARKATHIVEAHEGQGGLQSAYTGKGVLVGIIDTGFDFTHPTFRNAKGESRICAVWDQVAAGTTRYGYGRTYLTAESILQAAHDRSADTHGTHVAGIAVGGYAGAYRGVAPEADIALVATNKTEQGLVDGVDFLLQLAEARQQPLAINVSFGVVLGYKDGSGHFATMVDQLLAGRRGVLMAIATGNEGHRAATLETQTQVKTRWRVPRYGSDNLMALGEAGRNFHLTLRLRKAESGEVLFSKVFATDSIWSEKLTHFGTADADRAQLSASSSLHPSTQCKAIQLNLGYRAESGEVWEVEIDAQGSRVMMHCEYGELAAEGIAGFADGRRSSSVASTATGVEPIAVGAYVTRTSYTDLAGNVQTLDEAEGQIYSRSGQGPTFDGRLKPDVVAPGAVVVSALNAFAAPYSVPINTKVEKLEGESRPYFWGAQSGTSMATPVVTGTLALWLQAQPNLTAHEVRQLLRKAAVSDIATGEVPNAVFGWGKLDALAGLRAIETTTGVAAPHRFDLSAPFYDLSGRRVAHPHRGVYLRGGQKVMLR